MVSTKQKLSFGLTCEITPDMLEYAFSFGSDYFRDPAKVLQDRTGEKERGLGEILTANLYGKVIELGVCEILKNNSGKRFFPDMAVKSEFDYGKPDIVSVKDQDGNKIKLGKFVEIKYSPSNFQWIGLYTSQFEEMKNHVREHYDFTGDENEEIVLIYANIRNKKTGECLSSKNLDDELEDNDSGEEETVNSLTDSEKSNLKKLKNELDELVKERDDITKLPRTLSQKNIPHPLFPNMSLSEAREKNKQRKENIDKQITKKKSFIKNLRYTFQKRKSDLLGIYFKQKKFLPEKFDYFLDISDLEVVIEYVITGAELEQHGKIFAEDEIMPSNQIFFGKGKENKSYEMDDLSNTDNITHEKIIPKKINGTTRIPVENITYKHDFSPHFGDLLCTGDVEFIKQTKDTGSTLFLKCNSDVKVVGDFLGTWEFDKDEIKRIMQENTLPGRNGKPGLKNRSDWFFPKRNFSSIVPDLKKRVKMIAKDI